MLDILVAPGQSELDPAHIELVTLERIEPETMLFKTPDGLPQGVEIPRRQLPGEFRSGFGDRVFDADLTGERPFDIRFDRQHHPELHRSPPSAHQRRMTSAAGLPWIVKPVSPPGCA